MTSLGKFKAMLEFFGHAKLRMQYQSLLREERERVRKETNLTEKEINNLSGAIDIECVGCGRPALIMVSGTMADRFCSDECQKQYLGPDAPVDEYHGQHPSHRFLRAH